MHPLLARQLRKAFPHGTPTGSELARLIELVDDAYMRQDADRRQVEHSLEVVSGELTDRNAELEAKVQALQQMEVGLRHALKLEAVGQLASGIAHELNTPIQYIGDSVGYVREAFGDVRWLLDWYRERLHDVMTGGDCPTAVDVVEAAERADIDYALEQMPQSIDRALDGVRRVAALVRAMKDFAHADGVEKSDADLNAAIRSTSTVATNEIKHVADVVFDLGDIPLIPCHVGEINQVLLNLLINAAHAIADRGGARGRITVQSRACDEGVELRVTDTGCGIPAAIRDRVFEPFFTTKEVGRGSGQGLAIARTIIVEKHGGILDFETREGEGTTFIVRLPSRPVCTPPLEEAVIT